MNTLEQLRRGDLAGATRLDLSCGLTELPKEVFDLAETLEVLNLSGNRLTGLPDDMGRLNKLKILFGSNNLFTRLPESLGDCAALEVVGFKATRIREVGPEALPPLLRWLILTDNAIERLPDALGERPALQKLMLAGNRLQALPDGLANAHRLELLRLSANCFASLPPWLTRLPRLAWLALAGNPLGWQTPAPAPLPSVSWSQLQVNELLGEGASGHIHRVTLPSGDARALKLFKGTVTSDGLPEHEIAGSLAIGPHPGLCTPVAELEQHPQGVRGMLLPLLPPSHKALAGPPSMDSCTRDVYAPGFELSAEAAFRVGQQMVAGLAHLHARGVMHGDFYAHNILWNPANGDAMLSDMGAATVLPAEQPALAHALLQLEVRALGCLFEELVCHVSKTDAGTPGVRALQAAADACLAPDPVARPDLATLVTRWSL
ncbi:protein kinase [Hydrogenophaga crassostreae]|uniref:Protein kinase n=1 Tax=Hydrogenophaga crassostreae TaxID=1763535 RepID=A0A170AJ52_9BURK|nr:leucine-rich repeat-containing protein kinase family protein [Hydrogenophaga crassostreae]AOW13956.1 protein kinase [Hydrogenophaga crassostreae]OAD44079.1 protein kinase [Hydrogenophaga crassostreae]